MGADAAAPRPAGRRGTGRREGRARRGSLATFLVAGAIPALGLGWFLFQPEARRREILDRIPEGAGGRALKAALAFGVLFALARVALPAFHGASAGLAGALAACRRRPLLLRALLFPAEFALGLLWLLVQALFAADVVLILAAAGALLLLVARIVRPDLLPGVLPDL